MTKKAKGNCMKAASILAALTMTASLSSTMFASADTVLNSYPEDGTFESDYGSLEETIRAGYETNEKIVEEGIVLLKNKGTDNKALPLARGTKVTLLGETADTPALGGGGSGAHSQPGSFTAEEFRKKDLFDAMDVGGFEVNQKVKKIYENPRLDPQIIRSGLGKYTVNLAKYMDIASADDKDVEFDGVSYKKSSNCLIKTAESTYAEYDTALVVISRNGTESADSITHGVVGNKDPNKHILELNDSERELMAYAKLNFNKVVVIVNSPEAMELDCIQKDDGIDAIVWLGMPGWNGITALGKVLNGEVNPSGRLVDIYAKDFSTDPTWYNFGDSSQAEYALKGEYDSSRWGCVYMGVDPDYAYTNTTYRVLDYAEGIYMGYRYYETVAADMNAAKAGSGDEWYNDNIVYPFGYGLSYTTFSQTIKSVSGDLTTANKDGEVTVTVTVKNTGDVAGKEVVQIYAEQPYTVGGIQKAARVLVGFAKTKLLAAGESQDVTVKVTVKDLASFDYNDANENDHNGYELETGDYKLRLMANSHDAATAPTSGKVVETKNCATEINYEEDDDPDTPNNIFSQPMDSKWALANTLAHNWTKSGIDHYLTRDKLLNTDKTGPSDLKELAWLLTDDNAFKENAFAVLDAEVNFNQTGVVYQGVQKDWDNITTTEAETDYKNLWTKEEEDIPANWTQSASVEDRYTKDGIELDLYSMAGKAYDDPAWDEYMNQLTWGEIGELINNKYFMNAGLDSIGKPTVEDADGPGQLGVGTAWACEVIIASTWNTDLAYEVGKIVGNESMWLRDGKQLDDDTQVNGWYGPGINLHRSPLGGRNFEYYSQDPYHGGMIAAHVIKGMVEKGGHAYMKHVFLNEQETTRGLLTTFCTEQAIREIYAKPVEMAIKLGNANGMMTGYNRVGLESTASYTINVQLFTNEWGYDGLTCTDYFNSNPCWSGWQMLRGVQIPLGPGPELEGEWDDLLNTVIIDVNGEKVASPTQWYWARETAKRNLFCVVNGNGMMNGAVSIKNRDIFNAAAITDIDLSINENKTISGAINQTKAEEVFGTDYVVTFNHDGVTYDKESNEIRMCFDKAINATMLWITVGGSGNDGWRSIIYKVPLQVHPYVAFVGQDDPISTEVTAENDKVFSATLEQRMIDLIEGDNYIPHGEANASTVGKYVQVVYSIREGELPEGLTLDAETGVISGKPNAVPGDYKVTVRAALGKVNYIAWADRYSVSNDNLDETITIHVTGELKGAVVVSITNNEDGDVIIKMSDGSKINATQLFKPEIEQVPGENGADGVGIASALINDEGHLIVTLTNGETLDAGYVKGEQGAQGPEGPKGDIGPEGPAGQAAPVEEGGCNGSITSSVMAVGISLALVAVTAVVLRKRNANK